MTEEGNLFIDFPNWKDKGRLQKNSKKNDIGHLFFRPPLPYGDSDIKSSDKKLWGLTPPYPTLIVTKENLCLNLEQI